MTILAGPWHTEMTDELAVKEIEAACAVLNRHMRTGFLENVRSVEGGGIEYSRQLAYYGHIYK